MAQAAICDLTGAVETGAPNHQVVVDVGDRIRLTVWLQTRPAKDKDFAHGHIGKDAAAAIAAALTAAVEKLGHRDQPAARGGK